MGSSKDKMMVAAAGAGEQEEEEMDEMLAALGYKVRSSDMADVAQKLEQLEMAMGMGGVGGAGATADDGFISHLATDTVHYNPSDLSSWVESMLSELNAPPPQLPPATPPVPRLASTSSTVTSGAAAGAGYFDLPPAVDSSSGTYALKPIPSPVVASADPSSTDSTREPKRMRTGGGSTSSSSSSSSSMDGGRTRSSVVEAAPPAMQASAATAREGGEGGDEWAPYVNKMEVGILRGGQHQRGVVKPAPRRTKQPCPRPDAKSERF